jgi:hypothetical protein
MASKPSKASQVGHQTEPPCDCPSCNEATLKADIARREILEILARLDALDELRVVLAEDGR